MRMLRAMRAVAVKSAMGVSPVSRQSQHRIPSPQEQKSELYGRALVVIAAEQ
jgi:hypothetical protein